MKKIISYILTGVVGAFSSSCLLSCSAENPFESNEEVGIVRLHTVVNSITTRTEDGASTDKASDPLRANCVVYISNGKGLIYKEKGLNNLKESFTLKAGEYVAEAWTGDSVSASFDKKFYRGYEPFTVTKGSTSNVVLNCKIANVVASINTNTINPNLMKDDYEITIKNSRGELKFDKTNAATEKAYFMMPQNDTKLEYFIKGTNIDGESFTKGGTIENVKRAHNYILNFEYNPEGSSDDTSKYGAVLIKVNIKEEEITDNKIETFNTRPTITSFRYNLEKQFNFVNDEDIPETLDLQICGFKGFKYINISSTSYTDLGWPTSVVNILEDNNEVTQLQNSGLVWNIGELNTETNVITATVSFPQSLLAKLSKDATKEHVITVAVEDMDEPYEPTEVNLRFARNDDTVTIEDPIVIDKVDQNDWHNVKAHSVIVTYSLAGEFEGTPGVEYRKAGSEDSWMFAAADLTSNATVKIPMRVPKKFLTMTGLEAGCTYEYRGCCGEFHSENVMTVTTESTFVIPNASFEDWGTYKAKTMLGTKTVTFPGTGNFDLNERQYEDHFWDSGNEGAATANMTLTDKSTDMKHSGNYSARLASNAAMGVIAAGNIFTGKYVKTDGTNGVLSVGREFNGSHPAKLRVYANYRPGSNVSVKSGNESFLPSNFDKDHGQIYVALTTEAVEIRTKPDDRKLFDPDDPVVLAYGQVTWTEDFGPKNQLQLLDILLEYNERAETTKPTHLVIVCSASKYGDYFSGSSSSIMYLDDFELIYE